MDPDATLAELRELVKLWESAGSRGTFTEAQGDRAIELTRDLDAWLDRGGFLPRAWDHAYHAPEPTPDAARKWTRRRYAPSPRGPVF